MFEVFSGIAETILVVAAAVGAAIVAVVVMIAVSESLGSWREAIKYPPVLAGWIIAAGFAAYIAAKVTILVL